MTCHRSAIADACRTLLLAPLLFGTSCEHAGHEHGHDHPHPHEAESHQAEPPSVAITRWTPDFELFVELPAPTPGTGIAYHAHVTRLSDFHAVTEGTFKVRFKSPAGIAQEHTQQGVKRPGIFVFEGPAPAAGTYALEMAYEHDGASAVFDCGSITVASPPVAEEVEAPGAAITFLKESQWKIPFATAWAAERPLASEIEIAATVEPAASDQLTLAAPTGGRFFHNPKLALAEGLRVKKGQVLGSLVPNVAGDDYNRLQFAVEEARLSRDQLQREIERLEPLVTQKLLPERRLLELNNELETQKARLASAAGRLARVDSASGLGGLPIQSTLDGVLSQVLVPNGEPVEAGAPLARLGGTEHLWLRARFVAKPVLWLDPRPTAARMSSGEVVDLTLQGARFLSTLPAVDSKSRIATWIVDVPTRVDSSLRVGANVVLRVSFGKPESLLAVPREAVVEINTRPYVFTQFDGEHFEKRAVTLGRADGGWIQITNGIAQGERVVTRGGYDIHLAALMGTIESHRH